MLGQGIGLNKTWNTNPQGQFQFNKPVQNIQLRSTLKMPSTPGDPNIGGSIGSINPPSESGFSMPMGSSSPPVASLSPHHPQIPFSTGAPLMNNQRPVSTGTITSYNGLSATGTPQIGAQCLSTTLPNNNVMRTIHSNPPQTYLSNSNIITPQSQVRTFVSNPPPVVNSTLGTTIYPPQRIPSGIMPTSVLPPFRGLSVQGPYKSTTPNVPHMNSNYTVPTRTTPVVRTVPQSGGFVPDEDPQLQALKELRTSSGLKHIPVTTSLKAFKDASRDATLSKEKFLETYSRLLTQNHMTTPSPEVQAEVFQLFDKDHNNVVDLMELVCGISLLCQGSEEDKIKAVFEVFDENGDGFISMDEMFKFLTSVFKVVLTPTVLQTMKNMGVDVENAEDLASVTSMECFKVADLNNDQKLSIDEFKTWFYAPKNDPSFMFSPMAVQK